MFDDQRQVINWHHNAQLRKSISFLDYFYEFAMEGPDPSLRYELVLQEFGYEQIFQKFRAR